MKNNRAKRIAAWIGIILLLAMYGSTMVFALMDSPLAKGLLMGSVFCTVAVPVLLYGIMLVAKNLAGTGVKKEPEEAAAENGKEASGKTNPEDTSDEPSENPAADFSGETVSGNGEE